VLDPARRRRLGHRRLVLVPSKIPPGEEKKFQNNGASFDRTGLLPAAPGDPMLLPCTGLNRHWDGVGVLVMARQKSGARLPPQPSAFMKFAAGSTWTCMKMAMRKTCYLQHISRRNGHHAYAHDAGLVLHWVTCRACPEVHIWYCSPSRVNPSRGVCEYTSIAVSRHTRYGAKFRAKRRFTLTCRYYCAG